MDKKQLKTDENLKKRQSERLSQRVVISGCDIDPSFCSSDSSSDKLQTSNNIWDKWELDWIWPFKTSTEEK